MFSVSMVNFFQFFLVQLYFSASFLLESFRMTLPLLPFPFRRWHDSMFSVSTSASIPRNTPWILSSRVLSLTDSGMPEISRHSLLEYCSLAQHFHSVTTKRSINFTFMFRDIVRSDSILVNLVFSSSNSAFTEPRELSIYVGSPAQC